MDKKEGFPKRKKLRNARQYENAYKNGIKTQSGHIAIYAVKNREKDHRLGMTVSRKIGNAVVRNLSKRRIREIFRKNLAERSIPLDFVINAKKAIVGCPYSMLEEEIVKGCERLIRMMAQKA